MTRLDVSIDLQYSCGELLLAIVPTDGDLKDVAIVDEPIALFNLRTRTKSATYRYSLNLTNPREVKVMLINPRSTRALIAEARPKTIDNKTEARITLRECRGEESQEASRLISIYNSKGSIYPLDLSVECDCQDKLWFYIALSLMILIVLLLLIWAYRKYYTKQ